MQVTTVIIFLKAPKSGFVKTRLAQSIGPDRALEVYKKMASGQMSRIGETFTQEVHFTPATAESAMRQWLGESPTFHPQCEGNLGERLAAAIQSSFERSERPIICIGGDCPALGPPHLEEAAQQLRKGSDLVIGPSEDGGYYLIGMRQPFPELLRDVPWSTENTFSATVEAAKSLDLTIHELETLYDVDEISELNRAIQEGLLPSQLL